MIPYKYYDNYLYPIIGIVNVTDDCNLACEYCFVEKCPHYISLDTLKDIANFLVKNQQYQNEHPVDNNTFGPKAKIPNICFFGGEPMLMFDSVIKPFMIWARETYGKNLIFSITTNGTLLNEERIQFLKEYDTKLMLSVDGPPEVQDKNRPYRGSSEPSSKALEKNIPMLLKEYPKVTGRITAYAPTVDKLFDSYKYLEDFGFQSITIIPDVRHPWTQEQLQTFEEQFNLIYHHRLEQVLLGEKPTDSGVMNMWEQWVIQYLERIEKNLPPEPQYPPRCGIGIYSCSFGHDGRIYGCQEQPTRVNDQNNLFEIGNLYEGGIDKEKHMKLIDFYMEKDTSESYEFGEEKCKNCFLNGFCMTHMNCLSALHDVTGSAYKLPEILCVYHQTLFKNTLLKILVDSQLLQKKQEGEK